MNENDSQTIVLIPGTGDHEPNPGFDPYIEFSRGGEYLEIHTPDGGVITFTDAEKLSGIVDLLPVAFSLFCRFRNERALAQQAATIQKLKFTPPANL